MLLLLQSVLRKLSGWTCLSVTIFRDALSLFLAFPFHGLLGKYVYKANESEYHLIKEINKWLLKNSRNIEIYLSKWKVI